MDIAIRPLLYQLSPLLLLVGGAGLFLLLSQWWGRRPLLYWGMAVLLTLTAIFLCWRFWWVGSEPALDRLLFDRVSWILDLIFLISLLVTLLFSFEFLKSKGIERGEYYALLFFAVVGLMLIAHSGDLMVLFLGIEIASLSTYILTGFQRGSVKSYEAALKYFILGSFASAFLLYGIALAYGAVGSTRLAALSQAAIDPLLLTLALPLLLIGVGFKIAAVPFHFWSPDVYEGAPTPITGFMASAVKAAGFAALIRIVIAYPAGPSLPLPSVFWWLAVLTMSGGNLMALRQTRVKRMLAYSSIAHAGYALVGVAAAVVNPSFRETALSALLFYLLAYSLMTLGAFGVVVALGRKSSAEPDELTDYTQLATHHPWLSAVFALFLFSLIGLPPTIGFVGKFYLFSSAISAGLVGLVVIAVVNSAVSVFYYLGPVIKIYFHQGKGFETEPVSPLLLTGLFLCLFGVVYMGLFPSDLFLIAKESVRGIVF